MLIRGSELGSAGDKRILRIEVCTPHTQARAQIIIADAVCALRAQEFTRGKAGKGGGFVQVTMKDIHKGSKVTHKWNSGDKVETMEMETPSTFTLLYEDDGQLYLMDEETFDQIELPRSMIAEAQAKWLHDEMKIKVYKLEGEPCMAQVAGKAAFAVTEASMAKQGDNLKDAVLENGERIRVPTYIAPGERVVVNTVDGSFSHRE